MNGDRLEIASSMRSRMKGLLGLEGFCGVLVLAPCRDVHTYGMKFDLDIAFANEAGVVVEAYRGVPPGRRLRCPHAACVLERQSVAPEAWFEPGDRLTIGAAPPNAAFLRERMS